MELPASKPPPQRRATVVASFYLGLALLGFAWHAVATDRNDIWRAGDDVGSFLLIGGPILGLFVGGLVVAGFRMLETQMAWLPELHAEFRAVFGRPKFPELLLLALASSIGEELLFRGAMLDHLGLGLSSLVFALLHIPPKRSLWPWTVSAGVLGLLLGLLTLWTQNLGAAVAAHFTINLVNLLYITRNSPRVALRGPVRPSP